MRHCMRARPRTIRFYIIVGILSAAAAAGTLLMHHIPPFPDSEHIFWLLGKLPYLLLPLVAFLGWRLNQTRISFVALLWLAGYLLVRVTWQAGFPGLTGLAASAALATALPLATTGILLLPESRIMSGIGAVRALVFIVPPLAMVLVTAAGIDAITDYMYWAPAAAASWWQVPLAGLLLAIGSAVVLWLYSDKAIHYFATTTSCAYLPLYLALNATMLAAANQTTTNAPALGMTALSLLFGYALYRTYWENAYIDELTGILNRRALNERMYRLGRHYSVAMVDVDYFKAFNDTYGHAQGDTVLKFIGCSLERSFPGNAYRYGGEEFCVVFDGAPLRTAARRIEALRQLVNSKDFYIRMPDQVREHTTVGDRGSQVGSSIRVHISFSAGVAYRDVPDETPEDVIEMADKALYGAKRNGRAKVCCYAEN
ncbi:MAG: diguanylate cyclase [Chitinivibrionales bacterium]|nr:diguanylate cyclase [Chitinivibrionales bacterium]